MEVWTGDGWHAFGGEGYGIWLLRLQSMGKNLCPNFLQPLLENINKRSCNGGSRELIPRFHNPHQKSSPCPPAVARTLEYLEVVPFKAATSGREKTQVQVIIQETRDYLECGNPFNRSRHRYSLFS